MVHDDEDEVPTRKKIISVAIDHRPSARAIETMLLEEFHVSKAMKEKVREVALKISIYAADHFLATSKLINGEPQGRA